MFDRLSGLFPDYDALASLLGLLEPLDYVVTVDHSVLWQRHISWAKPEGQELRQYVTQKFSSNMVVLSLMLGAINGVFFGGSTEQLAIRHALATDQYWDIKFWIGIIMALDALVTLLAIITTFQAWGMVSAISDTNTHALLRSSIGQYVISLPPRLVVAAVYMFAGWFTMILADLLGGSPRFLFLIVVLVLFFQVIIPLSAFGRLIIHTGAMAKRRVLDAEFEKDLLPSGLHASLLLRATERRRHYKNPVHQYKRKQFQRRQQEEDEEAQTNTYFQSERTLPSGNRKFQTSERPVGRAPGPNTIAESDEDDDYSEADLEAIDRLYGGGGVENDLMSRGTANSGVQLFPPASFLNSATGFELLAVVNEMSSPTSAECDSERQLDITESIPTFPLEISEAWKDVNKDGQKAGGKVEKPFERVDSGSGQDNTLSETQSEEDEDAENGRSYEVAAAPAPFIPDTPDEKPIERKSLTRRTSRIDRRAAFGAMKNGRRRSSASGKSGRSGKSSKGRYAMSARFQYTSTRRLSVVRGRRSSVFQDLGNANARRPSMLLSAAATVVASRNKNSALKKEWSIEDEVRDLYDVEPPAELIPDDDDDDGNDDDSSFASTVHPPTQALANFGRMVGKSMRNLMGNTTNHQDDEADGDQNFQISFEEGFNLGNRDNSPLLNGSRPANRYGSGRRLGEQV